MLLNLRRLTNQLTECCSKGALGRSWYIVWLLVVFCENCCEIARHLLTKRTLANSNYNK